VAVGTRRDDVGLILDLLCLLSLPGALFP
jgi:hypothetical protein